MKLINKIKNKLYDISRQYNKIEGDVLIDPSVYVIGSYLNGNIKISEKSKLFQTHLQGEISIGRYSSLWGPNIFLSGRIYDIKIGNFCSIARNVSIQVDGHNPERTTTYFLERNLFQTEERENAHVSKGRVVIGNDVWIGAGAQILSGVKIGDGAIIGAGAIVTKSVPPYAIAIGNPARVTRFRFDDEKIKKLLELAWWDWSTDDMHVNKDFLLSDANLTLLKKYDSFKS